MHLIDLPFDILEKILCCLDVRDVLVCSSVCKLLQQTVNESLPLRYAIALTARGMADATDSFASLAERLESLESYELAWRELRWQETLRFDLPTPSRYVYQEDGHLLIVDPDMRTVKVVQLPSPLRGIPQAEHHWSAPPAFFEGDGTVLIDVRLDLVVFLNHLSVAGGGETAVQARTLSTGEIHPLADARATCFILRSPHSLNQVHRESDQSMSLRGRHILWGDSARGRIGNNNYITCPRLYDWANGRDVTPRLDGSVTCALTFLEGGRVISIVFAAGSYELWISDLESPDSEGRASVTHIFQFTFPAAWRVYVVPGASGTKVGLPTARLAQIVGNGRSCYFDHDDWVPFIVKFIMIDDHDVRPFTLRVPTSVFKKFTGRPREPEQLPVTIPYAAWSDGVVFEESEGLPFDSDTYRQAPHRIHGSRLYWWYYGDNALHVVDLHPRRLAWLTKDPNVRFRDTTFEVPNDARKPNAPDGPSCEMYFSVSGDCLVVQEHGHLDDADFDDERGPTYSIAVYSFV